MGVVLRDQALVHGQTARGLAHGPLRPILRTLADPNGRVMMPVLVARLDASPRDWNFAAAVKGCRGEHTRFMAWIMRGVVWVVAATDDPKVTLPIPATPLTDGLRLQDARTIRQRLVVPLILAPGRELAPTAPAEGWQHRLSAPLPTGSCSGRYLLKDSLSPRR